jgi:hypothetical protein
MRQLTPCSHCGRHYRNEAACPHCGKETGLDRAIMFRNLKMGALMAFTAATTAACYGSPPLPSSLPRPTAVPTSTATATESIPTKLGSGNYFVTPTGAPGTGKDILTMAKVKVDGAKLTIASATSDFTATLELPSADKLVAGATFELKDLKAFSADAAYLQAGESPLVYHHLKPTLPGNDGVTGSVTIADLTPSTISGTLTFQTSEGKVALYFYCER